MKTERVHVWIAQRCVAINEQGTKWSIAVGAARRARRDIPSGTKDVHCWLMRWYNLFVVAVARSKCCPLLLTQIDLTLLCVHTLFDSFVEIKAIRVGQLILGRAIRLGFYFLLFTRDARWWGVGAAFSVAHEVVFKLFVTW